jgi:hypothetical protein
VTLVRLVPCLLNFFKRGGSYRVVFLFLIGLQTKVPVVDIAVQFFCGLYIHIKSLSRESDSATVGNLAIRTDATLFFIKMSSSIFVLQLLCSSAFVPQLVRPVASPYSSFSVLQFLCSPASPSSSFSTLLTNTLNVYQLRVKFIINSLFRVNLRSVQTFKVLDSTGILTKH